MALRIGGPITTPSTSSLLTWGSVRSPLVLYNAISVSPPLIKRTTYSRAYPDTTGDDYPKFFIWESGSLFSWNKGNGAVPPYYYIEPWYEYESTEEFGAAFSIGIWPDMVDQRVDNAQFSELIGEEVTTDVGNFNITQDAHRIALFSPIFQFIPGLESETYQRILTIGKLTPI